MLIVCILDKDKRHGDAFKARESFQSGVSSHEAFRAKPVNHPRSWSVLPVGRGRSALGPLGPPGLTRRVFRSQLWVERRPAPSSHAARDFLFIFPDRVSARTSCGPAAEAMMTGAISVSQFYVRHAGVKEMYTHIKFWSCSHCLESPERETVCERENVCVFIYTYDILSKYTVTRVCILTLV